MSGNLIDIDNLSSDEILQIWRSAEEFFEINRLKDKRNHLLKGQTLINIFLENSTRTRTSFEIAGKRLGMDVVNIETESSSLAKKETIYDTIATLDAMNPDFIVIRSNDEGIFAELDGKVKAGLINAGMGSSSHPTQALLDGFVMWQKLKAESRDFADITVAICGDIKHSRVANSNLAMLKKMGANIRFVAPSKLLPISSSDYQLHDNLAEGIRDADFVMMLRYQYERMDDDNLRKSDYANFLLTREVFSGAAKGASIMHPGPVNRGVEITADLVEDKSCNLILHQVEAGVAVREAILNFLSR